MGVFLLRFGRVNDFYLSTTPLCFDLVSKITLYFAITQKV